MDFIVDYKSSKCERVSNAWTQSTAHSHHTASERSIFTSFLRLPVLITSNCGYPLSSHSDWSNPYHVGIISCLMTSERTLWNMFLCVSLRNGLLRGGGSTALCWMFGCWWSSMHSVRSSGMMRGSLSELEPSSESSSECPAPGWSFRFRHGCPWTP